ncbi:MAG: arginine deiminase family protein [Vulcanimicrobiota bacterium]
MDPLELDVRSEIGRLRAVMTHRPGREVDRMVPGMMSELLFEDILYGQDARAEHDAFRSVLAVVADEVLDISTFLAEALVDDSVRMAFIQAVSYLEQLHPETAEMLSGMSAPKLADAVIGGLEYEETFRGWRVTPLPNLLFVRDPLVVAQDGVLMGSMARVARRREPLIMEFAYGYHPRLRLKKTDRFYFDALNRPGYLRRRTVPGLEGGDFAVLSDKVLAIGRSERTSEVAIDLLANSLINNSSIETILMVLLPEERAMMHLDTVFSQTNHEECLVYPPFFIGEGPDVCPVIRKDLRRGHVHSELKPSLLEALAEEGIQLEPIPCGGKDPINQRREQWTDGANAVALAPGVIILYERNRYTVDELAARGYQVVHPDEVAAGKVSLDLSGPKKYVVLVEGHELSRARGGPHCMTMPLKRDSI